MTRVSFTQCGSAGSAPGGSSGLITAQVRAGRRHDPDGHRKGTEALDMWNLLDDNAAFPSDLDGTVEVGRERCVVIEQVPHVESLRALSMPVRVVPASCADLCRDQSRRATWGGTGRTALSELHACHTLPSSTDVLGERLEAGRSG